MNMLSPMTKKRRQAANPGQEPGKKTAFPLFKGFLGGTQSAASKIITSSDMKSGHYYGGH